MKDRSIIYHSTLIRSPEIHGVGLSGSSSFAALNIARELLVRDETVLDKEILADAALNLERHLANGLKIGAQDVYSIVYGGVGIVKTLGNPPSGQTGVCFKPIQYDPKWLSKHILIAYKSNGLRHEVSDLLQNLCAHPDSEKMIRHFSLLAEQAGVAIEECNELRLAEIISDYRERFNYWSSGSYINPSVSVLIEKLLNKFGKQNIISWKPPGAGAAESIALILSSELPHEPVISALREEYGWQVLPLSVSPGVCHAPYGPGGSFSVSAGARLDVVGAADIGCSIGLNGRCCTICVAPRSELIFKRY